MPLPDVWGELLRTPLRRSSHSGDSRKLDFHFTEFYEVAPYGTTRRKAYRAENRSATSSG
jgi:hypothetical protein